MAKDWSCYVCGEEVSWGTEICPVCGSALSWEEEDEDEPLAALMPPMWDGDEATKRQRWAKGYAIGAVVIGLLVIVVSVASGAIVSRLLIMGGVFVAGGVYGLAVLPNRYL